MSNTINATIICGLFDKDTKKQKISTQNAKNIIAKLILQHATGGTLTECQGLFTHSDGTIVFEPSIKIEVAHLKLQEATSLAGKIKVAINQESVYFDYTECTVKFI